jgi:beta-glucosidase
VERELGAPGRYWLTINEPTVYVMQGFVTGEWPPCLEGAWMHAARTMRNLARAHTEAHAALHRSLDGVLVGFAHNAPVIEPCNPRRRLDRTVASVRGVLLTDRRVLGCF